MNFMAKVVVYLALAMFVVSLFTAKSIGIEMIGVVQVAFIGLMTIVELPPMLSALSTMIQANGYNSAFDSASSKQTLPIPSLEYHASLVHNLNYTLAILILPLVISLVLYIIIKTAKED